MKRVVACIAAFVFAMLISAVASAAPAGSPVVLAFGDSYRASDGSAAVHRGADVACEAGEQVCSVMSGVVSFVGRVPAASGGTVLAVTVDCGDDQVTMLPLASATVRRGERIDVGDALGTAAGEGDASCDAPHVHVSLRRSGVHLDPAALIAGAPAPAEPTPASEQPAVDAPARPAQARPTVSVPKAVSGASPAPVLSADAAGSAAQVGGSVADAGDVRVVPRADVEPEVTPNVSGLRPSLTLPKPCSAPRATVTSSPWATIERNLRALLGAPAAIAVVALAFVAVGLVFSRNALERRLASATPVSDRFGMMLQRMRAGAKLCGLTSCSGFTPSHSRGRIAQRR